MNRTCPRRRALRYETLEARCLLAGDILQNVVQPLDVDNNDFVTPLDVLACINAINHPDEQPASPRQRFMDVNGDGFLTPRDPAVIINKLNRGPTVDDPADLPPRSIDGSHNNLEHPDWGIADTALLRITTVAYGDGWQSPAGDDRPSPRVISNALAAQSANTENPRGMADMLWQWGQFLDHDIGLTEAADPAEPFPIEVPAGDPFFDAAGEGNHTIDLERSQYDPDSGDAPDDPRQQTNSISALIDGSQVYGSDAERAAALRTFSGGRLNTSAGNLLPLNEAGLDNAGGTDASLFLAGDIRANEQVALTAMHTLFVREHNRLADEIAAADQDLSDEQIYQQARKIVIAQLQAITYNEFLPALLGPQAMPAYAGYDDTINPGLTNVFSTAVYRVGHTMLSTELLRLDENGDVIEAGNLQLRDAFFNPAEITEHGIEPLLRGLAAHRAQEIDTRVVDDVRNFLFGPPGAGGFDLAARNIQRGRDHGLPDYNQVRVDTGLQPVTDFGEITSDPDLQAALSEVSGGDVNQIDVWIGALAEDHLPDSNVGEMIHVCMVEQFRRLRDGDRYWYQRTFTGESLQQIEATTLADVIRRNTEITNLQDNVFFVV